jgi:hypothetical protein
VRALERATRIESEPHRRAFLQDALDVARSCATRERANTTGRTPKTGDGGPRGEFAVAVMVREHRLRKIRIGVDRAAAEAHFGG